MFTLRYRFTTFQKESGDGSTVDQSYHMVTIQFLELRIYLLPLSKRYILTSLQSSFHPRGIATAPFLVCVPVLAPVYFQPPSISAPKNVNSIGLWFNIRYPNIVMWIKQEKSVMQPETKLNLFAWPRRAASLKHKMNRSFWTETARAGYLLKRKQIYTLTIILIAPEVDHKLLFTTGHCTSLWPQSRMRVLEENHRWFYEALISFGPCESECPQVVNNNNYYLDNQVSIRMTETIGLPGFSFIATLVLSSGPPRTS